MRWAIGLIALLGPGSLIACGRGEGPALASKSQAEFRYRLPRPREEPRRRLDVRETRWRDSLVRNVGHRGEVRTYVRIEATFFVDGQPRTNSVWADVDRHGEFLAQAGRNLMVVDFERGKIGTSGTDGVSWHPHPTGAFVIALVPTRGTGVLGVTLDNSKAGSPIASHVTSSEAAWTWNL
jgi:hypothetical protein